MNKQYNFYIFSPTGFRCVFVSKNDESTKMDRCLDGVRSHRCSSLRTYEFAHCASAGLWECQVANRVSSVLLYIDVKLLQYRLRLSGIMAVTWPRTSDRTAHIQFGLRRSQAKRHQLPNSTHLIALDVSQHPLDMPITREYCPGDSQTLSRRQGEETSPPRLHSFMDSKRGTAVHKCELSERIISSNNNLIFIFYSINFRIQPQRHSYTLPQYPRRGPSYIMIIIGWGISLNTKHVLWDLLLRAFHRIYVTEFLLLLLLLIFLLLRWGRRLYTEIHFAKI